MRDVEQREKEQLQLQKNNKKKLEAASRLYNKQIADEVKAARQRERERKKEEKERRQRNSQLLGRSNNSNATLQPHRNLEIHTTKASEEPHARPKKYTKASSGCG